MSETEREKKALEQTGSDEREDQHENEILDIIRSRKSPKVIHDELEDYHENDIASVLPDLDAKERQVLYRLMTAEELAGILEYVDADETDQYLDEMDPKKAASTLEEMEADTAVDVLKNSKSSKKQAWLELMNPEARTQFQTLASYDEELIGSRMTTNFVTLRASLTIKEAMTSVITQAAEHDNISVLFVLDANGIYYGAVDLKDLIIARADTRLENIITTNYPYVYADERVDDCLETLKEYSEESIPVLSEDNRVVGAITATDIAEITDDEMGEDYAKLAGLAAEEDLKEPLKDSIRKRLPWLILLLGLGLVVSSVVSMFETIVAQLTILMSFQSLILDMSGNVGTQSLAVTIRVLMDEKLTGKQKAQLVFKEARVGFLNGLVLAALSFVGIGAYIMLIRRRPRVRLSRP
jgi:magnesium transporter